MSRYPLPEMPPIAEMVRRASAADLREQIRRLDEAQALALFTDPRLWDLSYQRPPEGAWSTWIMRFGRGGGKTHTGARALNEAAKDRESLAGGDLAIVGPTYADVTGTMIRGPSGLLAVAEPDFRPVLAHRDGSLIVKWPNGVIGHPISEDARERGRGKNLAVLWADEICAWLRPRETWDEILAPALRIGRAQAIVTTTPNPEPFLQVLEGRAGSVVRTASTFQNPYLPKHVRDRYIAIYGGTRLERQELFGEHLGISEHALWRPEVIEDARLDSFPGRKALRRVVVAIDPAVTAKDESDETGIVVAGIDYDGHVYVMRDATIKGAPLVWARVAAACVDAFKADRIVAETNNGGDLVEANLRAVREDLPVRQVRASRGKITRAEPVAALYERGLVHHVGTFPELEAQLTGWDPTKKKSPDRLDALVWAVTDLALGDDAHTGPATAYAKAYRGLRRRRR